MIDASEHLGVLHHVVKSATLDIPDHMQEEALSEGLVLLQMACMSYDAKHKVPVHYWLAKKLRWGLLNWKNKERGHHGANIPLMEEAYEDEFQEVPEVLHVDVIAMHEAKLGLEHLVTTAGKYLTDKEYIAIIGPAFGLHMKEVAHMVGANPNQIKELQASGRERMKVAMHEER